MANSYRENYIYSGDEFSFYISKAFCSWDYGITDKSAALLKHKSIFNELNVGFKIYDCATCTLINVLICFNVNPLSPDINMHILLTVLHTFHIIPLGRICSKIKTFHPC